MQRVALEFGRDETPDNGADDDFDYWCLTCRNKKPILKLRRKLQAQLQASKPTSPTSQSAVSPVSRASPPEEPKNQQQA